MKGKWNAKLYDFGIAVAGLQSVYAKVAETVSLQPNDRVLDVGCGTGKVLLRLYQKYPKAQFFGVDLSEDMIARARQESSGAPIKFKIASAEDLPFVNQSLDWVISTLALHHMDEAEKRAFIKEAGRVLRLKGRLLIADLGRPKNWWGTILAFLSNSHSFTKNNMAVIEASLLENHFKLLRTCTQFGYIEHIISEKI